MANPRDTPAGSTRSIDELDVLFADPSRWAFIDPDKLRHLLFYRCLAYGLEPDEEAVPRLMDLHRMAAARLAPAVRRQVVVHLARAIERVHREHAMREGAGCTNALLPFLLEDPDPAVVCSAAAEMAALLPLEDGDPLTGPRYVRSLLDQVQDEEARAGLIGGLLQLGDPRLGPLLLGSWRLLGDEGRQSLALLVQAFHGVHTLAVDFLLAWVEDEVRQPRSAAFGIVAATLARAGRHAGEHGVTEVRWTFPVTEAPEGRGAEVVREMTLEAFARPLEQRFVGVAEQESAAELMPHVLSYWGFPAAAYRLAAGAAARAAASSVDAETGVCEPVRLDLAPEWPEDPQEETLIEWGIFNPLGPSINTLRLTPLGSSAALVHTLYHPAATVSRLVALLPAQSPAGRVVSAVLRVMAANGTADAWLLRTLPDYVHLPGGVGAVGQREAAACLAAARHAAVRAGEETTTLASHVARLERLERDPWGTAREEIEQARTAGESAAATAPGDVDDAAGYERWVAAAARPAHVAAIRDQILVAWQRAIEASEGDAPQ